MKLMTEGKINTWYIVSGKEKNPGGYLSNGSSYNSSKRGWSEIESAIKNQ